MSALALLFTLGGLLAALLLRLHTVVVLGSVLLVGYILFDGGHPEYLFYDLWDALRDPSLFAVPPLLLISVVLAEGAVGRRWSHYVMRWGELYPLSLPGLVLSSVASVAALVGSASVAILLTGGVLYAPLQRQGFSERVSIGWICLGAVLGTLLPPALPLYVYASLTDSPVYPLLIHGLGSASVLLLVLLAYALLVVLYQRRPWSGREVRSLSTPRKVELVLAVVAPVLLLGLIWGALQLAAGWLPLATMVLLGTLLLLEAVVASSLDGGQLWSRSRAWIAQVGHLLPLLALSLSLSTFLLYQDYQAMVVAWLDDLSLTPLKTLLTVGGLAVLLGGVSEPLVGLAVATPVLLPVAEAAGIPPAAWGVLSVLSLGLGQLLLPAGSALMAAVYVFRVDAAVVFKAVAPMALVLWALLVAWIACGL